MRRLRAWELTWWVRTGTQCRHQVCWLHITTRPWTLSKGVRTPFYNFLSTLRKKKIFFWDSDGCLTLSRIPPEQVKVISKSLYFLRASRDRLLLWKKNVCEINWINSRFILPNTIWEGLEEPFTKGELNSSLFFLLWSNYVRKDQIQ